MTPRVRTAVILAAGMGARLRNLWPDRPKGFVEIGGETLVGRSVRLLRARGISRIVIVAGYEAPAYHAFAIGQSGVQVVENTEFATTGSMASLGRALAVVDDDFLLLESDLLYEARALDTLLSERAAPDAVLASGETGATDEVWVEAADGRLSGLSKNRGSLGGRIAGEFVGVSRVSKALGAEMAAALEAFTREQGHQQFAYETGALLQCAMNRPVAVEVVPDLLWGEIDCEAHFVRVTSEVWPAIRAREGSPASPPRRVLLNPGPATTTDTVKLAQVIPDVCPREQEFTTLLADVRARLARVAGDPAHVTALVLVGSGTSALEAAMTSFVPQDGRVLVINNGDYGERLLQIARVHGIPHGALAPGWGVPVTREELGAALDAGPYSHVFVVHHETSSGLLNRLEPVIEAARPRGVSVLVDAMSSFGALAVPVGPGGADVAVSSSNKCLQGMAGLGLVVASRRAVGDARRVTPRTVAFDLVGEFDHLERTGQSRFTVPPQVTSALRQALVELEAEGVGGRGARYAASMRLLMDGLRGLGFSLLLPDDHQSGILVAVRAPPDRWFDFTHMHDAMYAQGFTIYPGKAGQVPTFRLSVLGAIDGADISRFLSALGHYIRERRGH